LNSGVIISLIIFAADQGILSEIFSCDEQKWLAAR
jgi:hypothetical protein